MLTLSSSFGSSGDESLALFGVLEALAGRFSSRVERGLLEPGSAFCEACLVDKCKPSSSTSPSCFVFIADPVGFLGPRIKSLAFFRRGLGLFRSVRWVFSNEEGSPERRRDSLLTCVTLRPEPSRPFPFTCGLSCSIPTPLQRSSAQVRQYHVTPSSPFPRKPSSTLPTRRLMMCALYKGSLGTAARLRFSFGSKLSRYDAGGLRFCGAGQ